MTEPVASEPAEPTTQPNPAEPMPFDLWWSPSLRRFLARHENQDDEHLVWVFHGHHEALRHYLGTGLESNPPMPVDAVQLVLADPEQHTELEQLRRELEEASAKAEEFRKAYELKLADFAQETLRASELSDQLAESQRRIAAAMKRLEPDDTRTDLDWRNGFSACAYGVRAELQGTAHLRPALREPASDQIGRLRAERDERQARIDDALKLMDYWDAHGGSIPQGHRLRALLVGDQPPAEEPPAPRCYCVGPTHLIVCADQREPLSGVALRDVEEADDASEPTPQEDQ